METDSTGDAAKVRKCRLRVRGWVCFACQGHTCGAVPPAQCHSLANCGLDCSVVTANRPWRVDASRTDMETARLSDTRAQVQVTREEPVSRRRRDP